MCGSKDSTQVIESHTHHPRALKSPSSQQRPDPNLSSSSNPITESRSYNKDWSKSSPLSCSALASLKDSLPENPHIYDFSDIRSATSNFLANKFSSSSSSASWRCSIQNKDILVFQRKFRSHLELSELRDRLAVICRSHHSSLVKLLGASVSGNYIYLVYEYVQGASLMDCLHNRRNPKFTVLSSWLSRMQIATDIAHGLDYIHHFSGLNSNFIHNHIKSSNIIITENLSAKICHFGTSELCGEVVGETSPRSHDDKLKELKRYDSRTTTLAGTRGYMAPEFLITGVATQKSDVYAFGVVILELVSGEEALKYEFDDGNGGGYRNVSVVATARQVLEENRGVRNWVDKRLKDSFPVQMAEKMIQIGLECVKEDPNERPDMRRVAASVSKLYLASLKWASKMGIPIDLSVSLAPR